MWDQCPRNRPRAVPSSGGTAAPSSRPGDPGRRGHGGDGGAATGPDLVLTTAEFALLWADLGLGPMPYPLAVPACGRTPALRAEFTAEVYRELGTRGLAAGGRLAADLEALLVLLAGCEFAVDAVAHVGYPLRALAGTDRHTAVLAMLAGGEVWLTAIRPTALASAIAGVLPARDAGPGHGLSLPRAVLTAAAEPAEDVFGARMEPKAVLRAGGVSPVDTAVLLELAAGRRTGGQFAVSRTGPGRARRMDTLVSWFDTSRGRYLLVREDSWLSLAPASAIRLEHRLAALLSEVDELNHAWC
ncbi:ESX secretion-associated protein EspG [Amycolatopsis acidiphila]|uniref:ESX secretion-associated protein EspG n=1 Tax=Amycolatopsis acidiphila TaxID=715473 RepID=A0A557ZZ57_9PSEU|nr:ESX secretion-associated protein EspG [Amycolatopsis acidiphila]